MNATVLGYEVEATGETEAGKMGYHLTGKRGATYGLMRTVKNPHVMFVVRGSTGTVAQLKGYGWFTDSDGVLRPLNYYGR